MTKSLPFTEAAIRRVHAAARKSGLPITATTVGPDGSVTIHHQAPPGAPPVVPDDSNAENWANA